MDAVDFDGFYEPVSKPDPIKVISRTGGGSISYAREDNLIHLLDASDGRGKSHNYLLLPDRQASRIAAAYGNFWPVSNHDR